MAAEPKFGNVPREVRARRLELDSRGLGGDIGRSLC